MLERSLSDNPADRPSSTELYEAMHRTPPRRRSPVSVPVHPPTTTHGDRIGEWVFHEGKGWMRDNG